MSAKKQIEKEIREAYIFLREKNMTVPSETLQFMLDASLEKLQGQSLPIDSVSGCFPTDKEIELLSNEHSDDMGLRPNTYHSYKDGMEECIDIIKKNINNR